MFLKTSIKLKIQVIPTMLVFLVFFCGSGEPGEYGKYGKYGNICESGNSSAYGDSG